MHRRLQLPAALLIATILAGCGIADPYTSERTAPRSTKTVAKVTTTSITVENADPAPERGGTIPSSVRSAQNKLATDAGQRSPQVALDRYARLYISWTAVTVARVQRELASISLGQARAQALQAAASYEHDSTLLASHVANSGQVVSIAAGRGPAAGQWVIVTSETTTGQGDYQGLPAQLHVTYAQLTDTATGWVVSKWEPRS